MKITRIKYEDDCIKAFDGREKVGEFKTSDISDKVYGAMIEELETRLVDDGKWTAESNQLRMGDEGKPLEGDFVEMMTKLQKRHSSGKSEKKDAKKKKDKQELNAKGKKRMIIYPEQRVRKSKYTEVEDALDDFCVYVKGNGKKPRRILDMVKLNKVAKENGIVIKGMDNGHCKMNVQNSLRARYLRGEETYVDGKLYQKKVAKKDAA